MKWGILKRRSDHTYEPNCQLFLFTMSSHRGFQLFQGPLNSDLRRRQSTDYLSPLSTQSLGVDRSRLNLHSPSSATASPLRERFGALRRRDSTGMRQCSCIHHILILLLQRPSNCGNSPQTVTVKLTSTSGITSRGDASFPSPWFRIHPQLRWYLE